MESQSSRMTFAVQFVWKQIVGSRSAIKADTQNDGLDSVSADVRSRCLSDTSSVAVAFDQLPSRLIAQGGTLLLRRGLSSDREGSIIGEKSALFDMETIERTWHVHPIDEFGSDLGFLYIDPNLA